MLIVRNNNPKRAQNGRSTLKTTTSGHYALKVQPSQTIKPQSTEAIAIPAHTGDTVTIPVSNINTLVSVKVLSQTLTRSLTPSPSAGQYYFDYQNQQIIINFGFNASNLSVLITSTSLDSPIVKSSRITVIPALLRSSRVISGEFSLNQSFGAHPSGNFTLYASSILESTILNEFRVGKELTLNGIGFVVSSLSRARNHRSNLDAWSIALQGKWAQRGDTIRSDLDKPIRLLDLARNANENGYQYSYATASGHAGVPYSGANPVVRLDRTVQSNATTTLRQMLEDSDRLYTSGAYVDYSQSHQIQTRSWSNPQTFYIDDAVDLGSEDLILSESWNGFGAQINGIPLAHELSNATLELEQDPFQGSNEGDEWTRLRRGDRDPMNPIQEWKGWYFEAFSIENLKSLSFCFDVGSGTKLLITTTQLNGTTVEEIEEVWGWKYTSIDVYSYSIDGNGTIRFIFEPVDASLNAQWTKVKEITKKYTFDKVEGYRQLISTQGWELRRILQETDDGKEAIALAAAISLETDPTALAELQNQLTAYTNFFKAPVTGAEEDITDDLTRYYPDLRKKDEGEEDYVTPRYLKEGRKSFDSIQEFNDPRSTEDEPRPQIIIGQKSNEIQQIDVSSTNPERYLTYNPVSNQEGTNLEQTASAIAFTENAGRPSVHERLVRRTGIVGQNQHRDEDAPILKYRVSTPNAPTLPNNVESQTITFPGAYELSVALKGLNTKYSVINSQDSVTLSLPLGCRIEGIRCGDRVWWQGIPYRVFGISENWEISGVVNLRQFRLELGREVNVSVSVSVIANGISD